MTEFATCPVSQLGFARISAHPMLGFGLLPEQAFGVLRRFLADSRHRFIPNDLSCEDRVLLTERIPGSNHVTDHYLAALARQHGLARATFDEPLSRAFPDEPALVELVLSLTGSPTEDPSSHGWPGTTTSSCSSTFHAAPETTLIFPAAIFTANGEW